MYVSDVQTNLVGPTQLVLYINTLVHALCVCVCVPIRDLIGLKPVSRTQKKFRAFWLANGKMVAPWTKNWVQKKSKRWKMEKGGKCGRTAGFC